MFVCLMVSHWFWLVVSTHLLQSPEVTFAGGFRMQSQDNLFYSKFILKPFIGKFRCFLWVSPDLRAWDPKEYFVRFRQIDGVSKWKDNCLLI